MGRAQPAREAFRAAVRVPATRERERRPGMPPVQGCEGIGARHPRRKMSEQKVEWKRDEGDWGWEALVPNGPAMRITDNREFHAPPKVNPTPFRWSVGPQEAWTDRTHNGNAATLEAAQEAAERAAGVRS